ncbi:hypothetical protein ANN_20816, partial [Periplaneta americana]
MNLSFISELNYKDPSVHFKVDIGFPKPKPSRSVELKERLNVIRARRSDTEIEKLSRLKKLNGNSVVAAQMFPGCLISSHGDVPWPARSPDLAPCDFFLWVQLKAEVSKHRPRTLPDLRNARNWGNIPGSDISKGEVVWNYLQPFPPRGTGYHRLVFILYKQDKKMDYSKLKKEGP